MKITALLTGNQSNAWDQEKNHLSKFCGYKTNKVYSN